MEEKCTIDVMSSFSNSDHLDATETESTILYSIVESLINSNLNLTIVPYRSFKLKNGCVVESDDEASLKIKSNKLMWKNIDETDSNLWNVVFNTLYEILQYKVVLLYSISIDIVTDYENNKHLICKYRMV